MAMFWLSLVLAGPADVAAERAWLLSEAGRMADARQELAERLGTDPDPQVVGAYLDASAAMGLGPQALAETRSMPVDAPWADEAEPLASLMVSGATSDALDLARTLREHWPDRPDLLAPLWQDSSGGRIGRFRTTVLASPPSSPEGLARQLRLRHLIHQPDPALLAAVEQAFDLDAFGPPATDVELHDHARSLVEKGVAVADLDLRAQDRRAAVERAHALFLQAGNPAGAARAWEQLGATDAGAWAHRAEALRLAGDAPGSQAALEAGFRALGRPQPDDVTVADLTTRATHAAQLLAAGSEVELARAQAAASWAQAVAATALTGEVRGAASGPAAAASLADTYRGADKAGAALALAAKGADAGERRLHVMGAWAAVAAGAGRLEDAARSPELFLTALAEVWREGAMLLAEGEGADPELALAFGTLALAAGHVDRDLEALLARLHDRLDGDIDHSFAAFHHAAVARGMGADAGPMEALLVKHHEGLGDAVLVGTAVGGPPPPPDAVAEVPKRRSVPVRGRRSAPPKGGAVLGQKVPDFKIETPYGTLSRSSLAGRVVVFTFFVSDHAPSVEQLKEAGAVTKRLRANGIDVVHVGISRDANRGLFDDLHRVGQRWGQLAWAPQVATAFGVQRQPTTWVVDRNGIARYFVDHRILGPDLEAQIRAVAIE